MTYLEHALPDYSDSLPHTWVILGEYWACSERTEFFAMAIEGFQLAHKSYELCIRSQVQVEEKQGVITEICGLTIAKVLL